MIGKSESHSQLTHGHPLPDHLNPAKQTDGALKNDHEAGTSGAARLRTDPAPAHVPGQVAPLSLQNGSQDNPHRDTDFSGEPSPPRSDVELPPSSPDSPLPSWMAEGAPSRQASPGDGPIPQDTEVRTGRNSASSTDGSLGEILGLMGGGKFKNWDDIRAGLNRNEKNDERLDQIPFIAAHLDPDKTSPDHEKKNWNKLPDPNHPMFSDFVITQHPQYYSFRRPEQRSAPLAGQPQAPNAAAEPNESRLGRSHSMPGEFRAPDGPANPLGPTIPTSNRPGTTLGQFLERPFTPSPAGSSQAPRQDSQAGHVSRQNPNADPAGALFPSGADSEDLDLMNAVIGNPKKWGDLDTGIRKMKEEDARLDQDPFIAAHLDPEKKSPDHAKRNWDELPAPDHPMFRDFLITEHPEYYPSRSERRHSATAGNASRPVPEEPNTLGRASSLPVDLSGREPSSVGIQPLPPDLGVLPRQGRDAESNHPDATPPENGGPGHPQLDELIQENARLRKEAQAAKYKTYLAGIVGAGAGVAAGMVIASEVDDSSSNTKP